MLITTSKNMLECCYYSVYRLCFFPVPPTVNRVTSSPVIVLEGQTVILEFNITNDDPEVQLSNIVWTLMSNVGEEDIAQSSSNAHFAFSTDRLMLTVSHVQLSAHSGTYTLTATNEAGTGSAMIEVIIESKEISDCYAVGHLILYKLIKCVSNLLTCHDLSCY